MSDRKTMIPELLPDPKVNAASNVSPRERVVMQMREMLKMGLLATSGALATHGCFISVDPMPPPATCAIGDFEGNFRGEASRDDGRLSVTVEFMGSSPFTFLAVTELSGGTLAWESEESSYRSWGEPKGLSIVPNVGASEVSFVLPFECGRYSGAGPLQDGTTALLVTVFLLEGTDGGMPVDGGRSDGGDRIESLRIEIEPIRDGQNG